MKSPFVNELQPNQIVTTVLLVHTKDIRQKKTGDPFLSMMLADRTGEIDAKMWDNVAEVMDTFHRDDFIKIKGLIQVYQNRQQLTIHKLRKVQESEVDFADYFPASLRNPDEMFAELRAIIAQIRNTHLRGLLEAIFNDEKIARLYRTAPAAKMIHHAFLGGLIEHVLSVCHLCRMAAQHYRNIDADLLLTGALLHDIGKVSELTFDRGIGYSSEGQLLGHMVIALRLVEEKLKQVPGFPERLRTLVEHLIISHHGELGFGSPKVPMFAEALLLHHLDNLDSKMECMRAAIEKDRQVEGCWTGYVSSLERVILKMPKYLEDPVIVKAAQTPEVPQPVSKKSVNGESHTPPLAPHPPTASTDTQAKPVAEPPPPPKAKPEPLPDPQPPQTGSLFGAKLQEALRKET